MDYKKYNNTKIYLKITKALLSFFLLLFFVVSGYSSKLELLLKLNLGYPLLSFLFFVFITLIVFAVIFFPLNFFIGFRLEHKYNLSNQSLTKWIVEELKGALIGALILIPLLLFFYFTLHTFNYVWWFPFAIFVFFLSVFLARIVPVFILPFFYKLTPLINPELTDKIYKLAADSGLKIENIFEFDMSKNTKKANAAFTGIGKSKRIILGDTLLSNFSINEILTVIAHEIGHYEKKHIVKNILLGTFISFFTLFIISQLYRLSLPYFGFTSITELAPLPLLALIAILISLVTTPFSNYISRKFEYEADEYAVLNTKLPDDFSNTLTKLSDRNLSDKNPHPIVEWFSYSHPALSKRLSHIKKISDENSIPCLIKELT
ncbi:MAG: M48 family metallopeptidase [Ignavibacteriaceae bacterium]